MIETTRRFYVYAYLREDGTPYYIGRGQRRRAYNHSKRDLCPTPSDKSLIKIIANELTDAEANEWETDLIQVLGKISDGNGCLVNIRNGGQSFEGMVYPVDFAQRISKAMKGLSKSPSHKLALSKARQGQKLSAETIVKISEAQIVRRQWAHKEHGTITCGISELVAKFLPTKTVGTASAALSRIASGEKASAYGWICLDAPSRPIYEHMPEKLVFLDPNGRKHVGTASEVARATGLCRKALRKVANGKPARADSMVFGWSVAA